MRLINADALKEALADMPWYTRNTIYKIIDEAETVDDAKEILKDDCWIGVDADE